MSSSSSSVSTSTVNGTTRVTGLASGLDVDSIVSQLMTAERAKKLNKLETAEQKTEWTQTAYRSITTDIQNFSSKYFDPTSASSLMNTSNYLKYTVTSSDNAVTASANSGVAAGNHTVAVTQLATAAALTSSISISKDVQGGSTAPDYTSLSGKSIVIDLDGTSRTVALDKVKDAASLQSAIDTAFGSGKVTVKADATTKVLSITSADSGVNAITISAPTTGTSGLTDLGFSSTGAVLTNRLDTSSTLASIATQISPNLTFNTDGQIDVTLNGTALTFDKSDKLSDVMSKVNKSAAGVTMTYDKITGKLALTANATGAGNTLVATETSTTTTNGATSTNFLAMFNSSTPGLDAKITVDGQSMTRSSNTMTVNGVTYIANNTTTAAATVSVAQNTDGVYDYIKGFTDSYNTLIDTINTELSATYDSDYPPLTDDQKSSMTSDEITKWETKGKVGLLASDSTLQSLVSDLRSCVSDSVAGQSDSIFSIGISTGTYDEKGKLTVDEDTLKSAISSDPEGVMNLFTKQTTSKTASGTALAGTTNARNLSGIDSSKRYKEEGIAYRFYDTLQKRISTTRDSAGNKGTLLLKAGATNDASDKTNDMTTEINQYKTEISDEKTRLKAVNDRLYTTYSNLETYISKMNTQLSSLTSENSSGS